MSEYNPDSTDATLSRIETTLNNHVDESRRYRTDLDVKLSKHDARITELEESSWKTKGAVGILGGLTGAAIAVAAKLSGK